MLSLTRDAFIRWGAACFLWDCGEIITSCVWCVLVNTQVLIPTASAVLWAACPLPRAGTPHLPRPPPGRTRTETETDTGTLSVWREATPPAFLPSRSWIWTRTGVNTHPQPSQEVAKTTCRAKTERWWLRKSERANGKRNCGKCEYSWFWRDSSPRG